jgi:hypothetical protein
LSFFLHFYPPVCFHRSIPFHFLVPVRSFAPFIFSNALPLPIDERQSAPRKSSRARANSARHATPGKSDAAESHD